MPAAVGEGDPVALPHAAPVRQFSKLIRTPHGDHWHVVRDVRSTPRGPEASMLCSPRPARKWFPTDGATIDVTSLRSSDTVCDHCASVVAAHTAEFMRTVAPIFEASARQVAPWAV